MALIKLTEYLFFTRPSWLPVTSPSSGQSTVLRMPPFIEYVFNALQAELRDRMREVDGPNILDHIRDIIANIHGFQNYFTLCGY